MPNRTISSSPANVSALSRWNGYESGYGEIRYTTPGADGGTAAFDLGALNGTQISGAHLSYRVSSDSGARTVRFSGSSAMATDAAILEKLQQGARSLSLYFSFRASGGTGGEGSHSASCAWSDIRLELEVQPAGGVSGEIALPGGDALTYFTDKASVLRGEGGALTLNLSGLVGVERARLQIGGGEGDAWDEVSVTIAEASAVSLPFTVDLATWQGRAAKAWLKLILTTAEEDIETAWTQTDMMLAENYVAPTVNCLWSDEGGALTRFGSFVQLKSLLTCRCVCALDTAADANVCVAKRALALNGVLYESGTDEFSLGAPDYSGTVAYTLTVTDSHGLTGSHSGSLIILPYAPPSLQTLLFERYAAQVDEQGQTYYEPDDGSRLIRVSLSGSVSPLNGLNAWTLTCNYTDGETRGTASLLSGADGGALLASEDRSLFAASLSEQSDWNVTVTLTDGFETAEYALFLPKAGGIFNIEKGGVAVGMRSNGTRALPIFEVAYPAVFYDEVAFPGMDSLWQSVTLTNCEEYSADWPVRARRLGDLIFLRGGVKLLSALASGAAGSSVGVLPLATLGSEFRPAYPMEFPLVPDRSECCLHLRLDIDGSLTLYNRSGYQLGTSLMLPLNLNYLRA